MTTRSAVTALVALLVVTGGCAARPASPRQTAAAKGYELIDPPAAPDKHYPGGVHVLSDAPIGEWQRVAAFSSLETCESSRVARIDDSIDLVKREVGDKAKFQLPVRRAVHARCVLAR